MMTLSRSTLMELKQLANAAMSGPWEYRTCEECLIKPHVVREHGDRPGNYTIATPVHTSPRTEANMRFIAAANPMVVLALIEMATQHAPLRHA